MIKALFDFSFSEFVTTKLIKFSFGLSLVVAAILSLAAGLSGDSFFVKVVGLLIVAPIMFAILAVVSRLWHELIVVLFRIAENSEHISRNTRRMASTAAQNEHAPV
jgi:uncharacterized membrane protein